MSVVHPAYYVGRMQPTKLVSLCECSTGLPRCGLRVFGTHVRTESLYSVQSMANIRIRLIFVNRLDFDFKMVTLFIEYISESSRP